MTVIGQAEGTIPYRLRVGVTGHRRLVDDPALGARVSQCLQRVLELAPSSKHTPTRIEIVSPLAEGADRLVVREGLSLPGARLEVPLPLPPDEYKQDFATEQSKRQFDELLARANVITVLPPSENRDEAYARVGEYVVGRCDVLIALWDGQPSRGTGGTADIISGAREAGVPLLWIQTEEPFAVTEQLGKGIRMEAFRRLDEYNRQSPRRYRHQLATYLSQLSAHATALGLSGSEVGPYFAWSSSLFVRADLLALKYQTAYRRLTTAQFLLAAIAVAIVSAQLVFAPASPHLVWIEVVAMAIVLAVLFLGRHHRLHERWIVYRFLAERIRSALFLALVGVGRNREESSERIYLAHPSEDWLKRAFAEVWSQRPTSCLSARFEQIKKLVASAWVADQMKYHRSAGHGHGRRHHRLTVATEALFGLTLLAAVLHAFGIGATESHDVFTFHNVVIFLATSFPAVAGALAGIGAQREYLRHSDRFDRMASYLEAAKHRLERAGDMSTLAKITGEVEGLMLEESRDWFMVMRFHDFELLV